MTFTAFTELAAWWGATVSTTVFAWDIFKWSRTGPRLRLRVVSNTWYPDGRIVSAEQLSGGGECKQLAEYCHVEVLNVGDRPTTIINIEATHRVGKTGVQIGASSGAFVAHFGRSLPTLLASGEMWSARLEMNHLLDIAVHGRPIIRIRASHSDKQFEVFPSVERPEGPSG